MRIFYVVIAFGLSSALAWGIGEMEIAPVPLTQGGGETHKTSPAPDETKEGKKGGHGVAPVVGYDPNYGFVYGAAYFYDSSDFSFGTDFNLNFKSVYQAHLHVNKKLGKDWDIDARSGITKGFDPYYGEGGETTPDQFTQLWGANSRSRVQLSYQYSPLFSIGFFADFRFRNEVPSPDGVFNRRFPDEKNGAVGIEWKADTRKNKQNPLDAFLFTTSVLYGPSLFSDQPQVKDFLQIDGALTVYKEIFNDVLPEFIAAFSVKGGYSIGDPSFMYRYRLGGPTNLRGYLEDRFRGKKYYLQQTELRFPIWKFLGGAGYLGFGDAADDKFTNPKLAYGVGVRIGLPPDWTSKIRIDIGFGRDDHGVFAEFGHTF